MTGRKLDYCCPCGQRDPKKYSGGRKSSCNSCFAKRNRLNQSKKGEPHPGIEILGGSMDFINRLIFGGLR
jgi:hypothetical protein